MKRRRRRTRRRKNRTKRALFTSKLELNVRKIPVKRYVLIRNTWRVLECGAGECWRSAGRSVNKFKSITWSQGGEKCPMNNEK